MTHKLIKTFQYGVAVLAILLLVSLLGAWQNAGSVGASTIMGNDYQATSTAGAIVFGASLGKAGGQLLKTGGGTLASVVITGANTGIVNFYDATTTSIGSRANVATSSILLASFPANTAAGTYVFDAEFSDGLLVVLFAGNMPTTTIMYR